MSWFPEPEGIGVLASTHAGQLHLALQPAIWYMSLDTGMPPFDHVRVRQALNFAVDRRKVQRLMAGRPVRPATPCLPTSPRVWLTARTRAIRRSMVAPDLEKPRILVEESGHGGNEGDRLASPDWFRRSTATSATSSRILATVPS